MSDKFLSTASRLVFHLSTPLCLSTPSPDNKKPLIVGSLVNKHNEGNDTKTGLYLFTGGLGKLGFHEIHTVTGKVWGCLLPKPSMVCEGKFGRPSNISDTMSDQLKKSHDYNVKDKQHMTIFVIILNL